MAFELCGYLFGSGRRCGTRPTVAEYDATRGTMRLCGEHARAILAAWPAAPLRWLVV